MTSNQPDINRILTGIYQSGAKPHPGTGRWFREGLDEHMLTGKPMERCLGIGRSAYLKAQRNRHLIAAWQIVDESATSWGRCLLLHAQILNFKTEIWPYLVDKKKPDPSWSELRKNIFFAFYFSQGDYMVNTPDMIKKIVKFAGLYAS